MKVDFDLHFLANHEWPTDCDISEHGRRELESHEEFEDLSFDIAYLVAKAKFYGPQLPEAEGRANVRNARRGLAQFINALESVGPWLTFGMLHDDIDRPVESYFWEDQDKAYCLQNFVNQAKSYEVTLANIENDWDIPTGRTRNEFAHTNAVMLAELFLERGIPLSSYKDGKFFQVLRIVLKEIYPEIQPEAYRRYATSAIAQIRDGRGT